jgi:hypothetical protein
MLYLLVARPVCRNVLKYNTGQQGVTSGAILLSAVRANLQNLTSTAEGGSFTIEPSFLGQFYHYFCYFASHKQSGEVREQIVTVIQAHTAHRRSALLPFVMHGA